MHTVYMASNPTDPPLHTSTCRHFPLHTHIWPKHAPTNTQTRHQHTHSQRIAPCIPTCSHVPVHTLMCRPSTHMHAPRTLTPPTHLPVRGGPAAVLTKTSVRFLLSPPWSLLDIPLPIPTLLVQRHPQDSSLSTSC
jgi:hypothetical protein